MASFLYLSQIEKAVEGFLAEWNSNRQVPVPIEEIVELKMRIEIVPVNGLFASSGGVDGFLDRELKRLYVDMSMGDHRIRFTYAHEMGHYALHKDIFGSARFQNASTWKQLIQARATEFGPYEVQASIFASRLLMPGRELAQAYEAAKRKAIEREPGLKDVDDETVIAYAASDVARRFDVSADAAGNRLKDLLKERRR